MARRPRGVPKSRLRPAAIEIMTDGFISLGRIAWLVGIAILVMVVNIVGSILYMIVYGHVIDPGHEPAYYDAHVQVAAPYCSIVAGIPLMFLAGWWVSGWWDGKYAVGSALVIWVVYAAIDSAVLLAAGQSARIAVLVAISLAMKLASVYAGARFGSRGMA
jgi:hypothetical protein